MSAKISADQAGTASATALANSITTTQTSFNGSGSSVDSLSKRFINGYGAANQFQSAVLSLGRAAETNSASFGQQVQILAGISEKYGLLADSGALASKGYSSLSNAAEIVNGRLSSNAVAATGAAAQMEFVGSALVKTGSNSSALADAMAATQRQLVAMSANAGPAGVILASMGTAGLVAAISIGVATSAISALVAGADQLAARATQLNAFSVATGLSSNEIIALEENSSKFGVTADQTARDLETFTSAVGEAAQGSGTLFTGLMRVSPALALQVSGAKNAGQALDLVAAAYEKVANAGNAAGAAAIARAAFGRNGVQSGAGILGATAQAGGILNLGNTAQTALDPALVQQLTLLNSELTDTRQRATDAWQALFAPEILTSELQLYQGFDRLVGVLTQLQGLFNNFPSASKGVGAALLSVFGIAGAIPAALLSLTKPTAPPAAAPANDNSDLGLSVAGLAGLGGGETSLTASAAALFKVQQQLIGALAGTATPAQQLQTQILGLNAAVAENHLTTDQAAHAQGLLTEAFNVSQLQANISAMGALATPTQQYTLAVAKLKEELDESKISQGSFNIGVLAAQQAMNSSTESIKEQFGIASDADIATAAFTKYNNAMAAIGATAQQSAAGLPALNKQIQATIDSVHGAASATPQFTQMILDLQNANKTKDELLTSSGNALLQAAPAFVQALQQGQTIAQAIATSLTGAANSIANAFATAGAKSLVSGVTTGSLSSIGTGLTDFGIGTAISLVTGSIAKSQQAQQAFQQAQTTWAGMASQVAEFVCAMMSEELAPEATAPSGTVEKRAGNDGTEVIDLAAKRRKRLVEYKFRIAA
jgi:hypothetical protein